MANGVETGGRKGRKDMYANVGYGSVTMSAANTLTFAQIQMAVGLFQGIGMIIHRIEWWPGDASLREMVAATDTLSLALVTSNRIADINVISDPAIIALRKQVGVGIAVAAQDMPWITDLSSLPGGGKLVSPNPIWVAMYSAGFVAAGSARVKLDFTFVELSDRDYLELIQAQFPANIT